MHVLPIRYVVLYIMRKEDTFGLPQIFLLILQNEFITLSHYILSHFLFHIGVLIVPHAKKMCYCAHPIFRYCRKVSVWNILLLAKLPKRSETFK